MKIFVPGRICLFGEHSDWAGGYRRINADIERGYTLICGTNQGIHAEVEPHPNALVLTSTTNDGEVIGPQKIPLEPKALLEEAQGGGFFSYAAGVAYQAPKQWIAERPASGMRRAQYRLPPPDDKGQPAELVVYFFPGTGGDVQSNIDRWYGQFRQPDGSATRARAKLRRLTVNGLKTTVLSVNGTYLRPSSPTRMDGPKQPMPDHALLAAIVETAGGPWFFKAVGPRATIEAQRAAFNAFVQTVRAE